MRAGLRRYLEEFRSEDHEVPLSMLSAQHAVGDFYITGMSEVCVRRKSEPLGNRSVKQLSDKSLLNIKMREGEM